MKYLRVLIWAAGFAVFGAAVVDAASYCVRPGATGNGSGSDWTNAFTALPQDLVRGSTYYLADGTYGGYTFDDPVNGTLVITILKATSADHGPVTGWVDSFGDNKAVFPGNIYFSSGYYLFDGAVGEKRSGYGFEILETSDAGNYGCVLMNIVGAPSHITIRHTDIHRPSRDHMGDAIHAPNGPSFITVDSCYLHDLFGNFCNFVGNASNILIENSYFVRNRSTPAWHSEAMMLRGVQHFIVRNNMFEDIQGTGVLVSGSGVAADWQVYSNVFNATPGGLWDAPWILTDNFNDSITDVYFYNNLVNNMPNPIYGGVQCDLGRGEIVISNNIFKDCEAVYFAFGNANARIERSYNDFVDCVFGSMVDGPNSQDPNHLPYGPNERDVSTNGNPFFVDEANGDFRLLAPTAPGKTLAAPYNIDVLGNARGADGVWDRGAVEFGGTPPAPPKYPSRPHGFRVR
jgi:hypothetical protein